MRRYSMPEREAISKLNPKSPKDRRKLLHIFGYLALITAFIVTDLIFKQRHQEKVEQTWQNATATIEDVRPVIASQIESARGGAMLYQVELMVKYPADGVEQKRWIRLERMPETLQEAQLQSFRWKGKQCTVRWKTSQPDRVIAEVN